MPLYPDMTAKNLKAANQAYSIARKPNPPGFMATDLRGMARRMYQKMKPAELEDFIHATAKKLKESE